MLTPAQGEAIASLRRGDWQAAHVLVQDLTDPIACRIHALCHRIEGDMDNARYWYQQAKTQFPEGLSITDELAALEGGH